MTARPGAGRIRRPVRGVGPGQAGSGVYPLPPQLPVYPTMPAVPPVPAPGGMVPSRPRPIGGTAPTPKPLVPGSKPTPVQAVRQPQQKQRVQRVRSLGTQPVRRQGTAAVQRAVRNRTR